MTTATIDNGYHLLKRGFFFPTMETTTTKATTTLAKDHSLIEFITPP
jgi:hypothetical protein